MAEAFAHREDSIEDCLDRIKAAWNAGDAHAFGRSFTENATYVIFLGDVLVGRGEIESNHVQVFTKWQRGTRMTIKTLRKTPLGEDSAVVLTAGGGESARPFRATSCRPLRWSGGKAAGFAQRSRTQK